MNACHSSQAPRSRNYRGVTSPSSQRHDRLSTVIKNPSEAMEEEKASELLRLQGRAARLRHLKARNSSTNIIWLAKKLYEHTIEYNTYRWVSKTSAHDGNSAKEITESAKRVQKQMRSYRFYMFNQIFKNSFYVTLHVGVQYQWNWTRYSHAADWSLHLFTKSPSDAARNSPIAKKWFHGRVSLGRRKKC